MKWGVAVLGRQDEHDLGDELDIPQSGTKGDLIGSKKAEETARVLDRTYRE